MPTIDPNLVPVVNPGDLFNEFTTDASLNIRWLTATDPAHYEILNRPTSDLALRQLILAKAIDALDISLGYQAIFPFIISPQVTNGSVNANIPVRIFWDMHVSLPTKWVNIRLARIDRLDGDSGSGGSGGSGESGGSGSAADYTGHIRFIFTAQEMVSGIAGAETAIFYADYEIDSTLTYQRVRATAATAAAIPVGAGITNILDSGDIVTIDGWIVFRTLDTSVVANQDFFELLGTVGGMYETVDSQPMAPDFEAATVSHGTGMLTSSAYNYITEIAAAPSVWLEAFNYPFDPDATLHAVDSSGVQIPAALFREFDIVAPAGDQPTGDTSGAFYPVWISKIERLDGPVPTFILYFSTYGISPVDPLNPVEFATMTLTNDMVSDQVVAITPYNHLFSSISGATWHQEFGRGHVLLSSKWGVSGGEIDTFFNSLPVVSGGVSTALFSQSTTRVGSWGISRVPKYSPTAGQSAALAGTTASWGTPIYPGTTNRYVSEKDEGWGDQVDLDSQSGITPNAAVGRYGNMGTKIHKLIKLVVDPAMASQTTDPNFYTDYILPKLIILLGRSPVAGDEWYDGSRKLWFNGDAWMS